MSEAKVILLMTIAVVIIGTFTSCTDIIDPSAANSLAAVVAVVGEYLYAALAFVLVVLLRILRPAGIALAILGLLGLCSFVELSTSGVILVCNLFIGQVVNGVSDCI